MKFVKEKIKGYILYFLSFFKPNLSGISVLMYHSISDSPVLFAVREKDFRKQMLYIKKKGLNVERLSKCIALLKNKNTLKNTVCLTFDDGYKDNYTNLLPILKEFNFPATVFVSTSFIGSNFSSSTGVTLPMLSRSEILEMHKTGLVDFMPHSVNHYDLSKIDIDLAIEEAIKSKKDIENITGGKSDLFAYPKGRFSVDLKQVLKKNGFSAAFGVKSGIVNHCSDFYDLPRNYVNNDTGILHFKSKLTDIMGSVILK